MPKRVTVAAVDAEGWDVCERIQVELGPEPTTALTLGPFSSWPKYILTFNSKGEEIGRKRVDSQPYDYPMLNSERAQRNPQH